MLEGAAGDWHPSGQPLQLDQGNSRFQPFLAFHRLLLGGRTTGTGSGADQTFSLLFPMERVFEDFIAGLLRRHAKSLGLPGLWTQGPPHAAWLAQNTKGSGVGQLKPDLVITNEEGQPQLIIDTKWQTYDTGLPGPADLYQMHAYAAHWGCRDNMLLLPAQGREGGQHLVLDHDRDTTIRIGYVNINQSNTAVLSDLHKLISCHDPSNNGHLIS